MTKIQRQNMLPKNFAEQLLNCQIEVELNDIVPKEIIIKILQLYSKGMEYFESIRSYKYMYFQRKMNAVMRLPKIINSMSNSQSNPGSQKKSTNPPNPNSVNLNKEDKIKIMQVKHKYEKMYNDLIGQTSALTGDKIREIVTDNEIKLNEVKQSIKDQISQQERRLQIKLERRKFQKQTRSKKSMSAAELEKSTRDSLFNDNQFGARQKLEADFSKVINEHEYDSEDERGNYKTEKIQINQIFSADRIKKQFRKQLDEEINEFQTGTHSASKVNEAEKDKQK